MRKHFNPDNAPEGLTFNKFLQTLDGYSDKKFIWTDEYKATPIRPFFCLACILWIITIMIFSGLDGAPFIMPHLTANFIPSVAIIPALYTEAGWKGSMPKAWVIFYEEFRFVSCILSV